MANYNMLNTNAPAQVGASFSQMDPVGNYNRGKNQLIAQRQAEQTYTRNNLAMGNQRQLMDQRQQMMPGKFAKQQQDLSTGAMDEQSKKMDLMQKELEALYQVPDAGLLQAVKQSTARTGQLMGWNEQQIQEANVKTDQLVQQGGLPALRQQIAQSSTSLVEHIKQQNTEVQQGISQQNADTSQASLKLRQDEDAGGADPYEGLSKGYEEFLRVHSKKQTPENFKEYQSAQAANKKLMTKAAVTRPLVAKFMADGWMPSGRITGPQLDAFEAAAQVAEEAGTPLTVERLRDMDFQATKNRSSGRTSGSRLVTARKQNIETAQGLLKDMKATSDKLDYSDVQVVSMFEGFAKGQVQDPIFVEYMTQRADALMALSAALKQNGVTDKSIEIEEQAFKPTLGPKAFNAYYNTQVRALNRAAWEMNRDYDFDITTLESFLPGQGGQGKIDPESVQGQPQQTVTELQPLPATIATDEDYNSLPSGTEFIAPDGSHRRKP